MKSYAALLVLVVACSGSSLEPFDEGEVVQPADASATIPVPSPAPSAGPSAAPSAGPSPSAAPSPTSVPDAGAALPPACAGGVSEIESNDATAKATSVVMGKTCGLVGPGDVDFFVLDLDGTASIRFDADSEDVQFFLVDDEGGGNIPLFRGDEITMTASGKTFFRVEGENAKTKQSYTIMRQ